MCVPLRVADLGLGHPGHSLISQLHTPETAGSKSGELLAGCRHIIVRSMHDAGSGRVCLSSRRSSSTETQHTQKASTFFHGSRRRRGNNKGPSSESRCMQVSSSTGMKLLAIKEVGNQRYFLLERAGEIYPSGLRNECRRNKWRCSQRQSMHRHLSLPLSVSLSMSVSLWFCELNQRYQSTTETKIAVAPVTVVNSYQRMVVLATERRQEACARR